MSPYRDVIVVGGGPGGAACAAALARGGRRVLLLERAFFPRDHVGESLSPAACEAVRTLGLGEELQAARFAPKAGATFAWGGSPWPWTVAYPAVVGQPSTYHVRRAEFDAIVLRAAAAAGAEVRMGWQAEEVMRSSGSPVGVLATAPDGRAERLLAPWVVDASGAPGVLGGELGQIPGPPELDRVAIWGYWRRKDETAKRPSANSLLVGRGGTCFWYYPLDDQASLASVGVVVPSGIRLGLAEPLETFYRTAVDSCQELSHLASDGFLDGPVREGSARAYASPRMAGQGWFLVGDAACFVDPLLTPGVQLAIQHGTLAAQCLLTLLEQPAAQPSALDLYDQVVRRQYETFTRLSLNLYWGADSAREPDTSAGQSSAPAPAREARSSAPDGQFAFLGLISGLARTELAARLGNYIGLRERAATLGGGPVAMGEKEGFAFLTWLFHQDELARARAERIRSELAEDSLVLPALGAAIGEQAFLPDDGAQALAYRTALSNRLGDRFAATPEIAALFTVLGTGRSYEEARLRFCAAAAVPEAACRSGFRDWIELLADHLLIEWRPAGQGSTCAE